MSKRFLIEHLGGLRLTGRDARAFCQAQFTGDVESWPVDQWQITGWCNSKGRVLASILASSNEDGVDLILPSEQLEIAKKFSVYAIGRQVEFSDGWFIEGSFEPAADDKRIAGDATRALRLTRDGTSGSLSELIQWRIADLCIPLPWLTRETTGRYLPQSLGLENNNGLSYTKGCFPGQEVIARVHYLGKVKQHLLAFEFDAGVDAELAAGDSLLQTTGALGTEILSSLSVERTTIGLGVSPIDVTAGIEVVPASDERGQSGRMATLDRLCYYREKSIKTE